MAKSLLFRMLTKKVKYRKTWKNTYVLRQEYNKYQRTWYPVILYWNQSMELGPLYHCWVEGIFTEDGTSFYSNDLSVGYPAYDRITKPGTSKCDPEHVKAIVDYYTELMSHEPVGPIFEVKRLGTYRPVYKAK